MGYTDRQIEAYFAPYDPAFRTDEEPVNEQEEAEKIIMGDLFAQLEKVFARFSKYDRQTMMDNYGDVIDKVTELMEE